MKKILFIIACSLSILNTAKAQFRIGPLVGGSVSRFIYEDVDYRNAYKTGFKPGFHAGAVMNYRVNKLYSLHTELYLTRKGKNVSFEDEFVKIRNNAMYTYFSAPILLRLSSHQHIKKQRIEFYVNIGPNISYWLSGDGVLETSERSEYVEGSKLTYTVSFDKDKPYGGYMIVEDPSRIQMTLDAGGGMIFDFGWKNHLALDFRGSFGIGKTFHGKQDGGDYGLQLYSENLEGLHHTFSVSVAYLMNLDLDVLFRKGKSIR